MILTVEEAKEKICCLPEGVNIIRCIADGCMAWRWVKYEEKNGTYYPCDNKGYCGLAGQPEGA